MRPFRSRLLLRSVAALVVVGVAVTMAPPALARDAQEDALRSLLSNAEAFETALLAAHEAGDGAAARDAFVQAYVAAADGEVAADVIYQLLDGPSFGLVAPVVPDAAFAPEPTATPSAPGSAVVVLDSAVEPTVRSAALVRDDGGTMPDRPEGRSSQPRAP